MVKIIDVFVGVLINNSSLLCVYFLVNVLRKLFYFYGKFREQVLLLKFYFIDEATKLQVVEMKCFRSQNQREVDSLMDISFF